MKDKVIIKKNNGCNIFLRGEKIFLDIVCDIYDNVFCLCCFYSSCIRKSILDNYSIIWHYFSVVWDLVSNTMDEK